MADTRPQWVGIWRQAEAPGGLGTGYVDIYTTATEADVPLMEVW